jgi:hypothetical protein
MVKVYVVIKELGDAARQHQKELFGAMIGFTRAMNKKDKNMFLDQMMALCGRLGQDLNAAFENVKELE